MKTRIKLGLIALVLVSLLLGVYIGYSATPSNPIWISSGVYPGDSVTIWREGNNYFVKTGFGNLLYGNTNATLAYETGRNYLTNGGTIKFKEGSYVFTHTLWLESNIDLVGSGVGNTLIQQSGSADLAGLIRAGSTSLGISAEHNISIRDFTLIGRQGGASANNGLAFDNATHIRLQNLEVYNVQRNGFYFYTCSNIYGSDLYVENVEEFQAYSTQGIFDSQFNNLQAVNCASYGMDLSYAVNVTVNGLIMKGENTTLKIDLGNAGEYCDGLTLSNIQIYDFGASFNGMIIEEAYNSTISNFVIANGYRGIRVGASAYSLVFSNGIISQMISNGVYLADGDHLSFSNIIIKDTTSTCFPIGASVNYATLIGVNAREGGYITDAGTGSHIHLCWNSTTWVS